MSLRKEIEHAINRNSAENGSNTPDWILAAFLVDCLQAFDAAVVKREGWYGRELAADPRLVEEKPKALHDPQRHGFDVL